ncbi:hypothetical protein B0H19DRAFT_1122042 [Mycena capillaripes]|nr:hypothetical protein B0H19DRAFT_1122042 [Mycena capillaripes]
MLASLEADRARVASIKAQISALEHSISQLRIEKSLVQERLASYRYPVMTLPNEIVCEIFMHFLPTYPDAPPLAGISSPTLLTQICRGWRDIALRTPALWRALTTYESDIIIPTREEARIIAIWINRSRSCPLSLRFDIGNVDAAVLAAVYSTWASYRASAAGIIAPVGPRLQAAAEFPRDLPRACPPQSRNLRAPQSAYHWHSHEPGF